MSKSAEQFFDWSGKNLFKEKLVEAMRGESSRAFSARCGLSDTVIRNYLNGKTLPSLDRLAQIAEASGKDMAWFLGVESDADINSHSKNKNATLTSDEIDAKLHSIFELMSDQEKQKAIFIFKISGLSGLMPRVVDIETVAEREILQQCCSDENPPPAPSLSTQNKKVG